jgi:hypothetical protein
VKFLSPEAQFRAGVNNREDVTTPDQLVLDVAATAGAPAEAVSAPTPKPGPAKFAAIQLRHHVRVRVSV